MNTLKNAIVYSSSAEEVRRKRQARELETLKINQAEVRFLREELRNQCTFFQTKQGDEWYLVFFDKTPYQRVYHVVFQDEGNYSVNEPKSVLLKMAYRLIQESDRRFLRMGNLSAPGWLENVSCFVYGTKAITLDKFESFEDGYRYVDGKGFIYLANSQNDSNNFNFVMFCRYIVLSSLACAYLENIEDFNKRLMALEYSSLDTQKVKALFVDIATFHAKFFLRDVTEVEKGRMRDFWQAVSQSFALDLFMGEVKDKISTVHHIFNIEETIRQEEHREHQEKISRRWNYVFAVIGIILALLQLV